MISTPVGPSTWGGCLAGDLNTWERLAVIKNRVCHALKTHPISLLYREMFFFLHTYMASNVLCPNI